MLLVKFDFTNEESVILSLCIRVRINFRLRGKQKKEGKIEDPDVIIPNNKDLYVTRGRLARWSKFWLRKKWFPQSD